jgi:hypothetical protein
MRLSSQIDGETFRRTGASFFKWNLRYLVRRPRNWNFSCRQVAEAPNPPREATGNANQPEVQTRSNWGPIRQLVFLEFVGRVGFLTKLPFGHAAFTAFVPFAAFAGTALSNPASVSETCVAVFVPCGF